MDFIGAVQVQLFKCNAKGLVRFKLNGAAEAASPQTSSAVACPNFADSLCPGPNRAVESADKLLIQYSPNGTDYRVV